MSAEIHNGQITCPHCDEIVQVTRTTGKGATYTTAWKKLPKRCQDILLVWVSEPKLWGWTTKSKIREILGRHGLQISEDSINARVSELLGCDLIHIRMLDREETKAHHTRKIPEYSLNTHHACRVLSAGGKL